VGSTKFLMLTAFRKHDRYIYDVFNTVDDHLNVLLDVISFNEQLCWFSVKQASFYSYCSGSYVQEQTATLHVVRPV
jgi:hypothetical protein